MKTGNAMQLKAFIKNKANECGISAQAVLQNYLMERLLERISLSEYRDNFIIKGGFLLSSIIGIDKRTTMDIDTTAKKLDVTHENLRKVFNEICSIEADDDIKFELTGSIDIREADDYPGVRLHIVAGYEKLNVPMAVDVTAGDKITPAETKHRFKLMFEERYITLPAYNVATILAEKLETILSRSVANTRPRDFYDVYVLYQLKNEKLNYKVLRTALTATATKRNSLYILENYRSIIAQIEKDRNLENIWNSYCEKFSYAKNISFKQTAGVVEKLMESISNSGENK